MELEDLEQGLRSVSSGGHVLSCMEITSLQAGLTLLKTREKHSSIFLWGKILGKDADYYIAYGICNSAKEFPAKTFYYAGEDFDFKSMPALSAEDGETLARLELGIVLTGNPNAPIQKGMESSFEDASALTEVHRLAQTVQELDYDTSVVPKGAYALNENNVVPSCAFQGLSASQVSDLKNYVHFRPPVSVASLKARAIDDVDFHSNFLDTLEGDLPKGCWAIRQDPASSLTTLRSLVWPGYMAYHIVGTTKFGGIYFGHAQKNKDLPFIL
eukprot:TRINITY_DN109765_c0_g1_i1.p1 TRINITY_DN109765_c0_g1~~TRINITY_DN109765_c0_g1_i1.p1  ORF type:complete len:271 (+),score=50.90 TRINITY_DN109765_c0_g1_i1:73-885(+)